MIEYNIKIDDDKYNKKTKRINLYINGDYYCNIWTLPNKNINLDVLDAIKSGFKRGFEIYKEHILKSSNNFFIK